MMTLSVCPFVRLSFYILSFHPSLSFFVYSPSICLFIRLPVDVSVRLSSMDVKFGIQIVLNSPKWDKSWTF